MATNSTFVPPSWILDSETSFALFPAEMPVSYDAAGKVASLYGDLYWDLTSTSTDATSPRRLYFHPCDASSSSELDFIIREQHKALMWLHMDAGRPRSGRTLLNTNLALVGWCAKAAQRGIDLYTGLTNIELLASAAQGMNVNYLDLTSAALRTLWRHRGELRAAEDIPLEALQGILNREARSRADAQQTPLIPSRVYSAILAKLVQRLDLVERELANLGEAPTRRFGKHADVAKGGLVQHQLSLMLTVSAFSGMRVSEVAILPLKDVLVEFEHMGATHFVLQGFTHKLHDGVKVESSWITSHQGARSVQLAQKLARAMHAHHSTSPEPGQVALLFPSLSSPYKRIPQGGAFDQQLKKLRVEICPVVDKADIEELDALELSRGWLREGIEVGKHWPLKFHQLRRSLAVYAHRSGMVGLPALKSQLHHITEEMSAYYADGFSRAVNLVVDPTHFSREWEASTAESSYFAFVLGVMFSGEELLGQGASRLTNAVESRSREATLRLFQEGKLAYRETTLGGCAATEDCKIEPLEPIPYECLSSNCPNLVVFGRRLDHVIDSQRTTVFTLERDENGSVEHRLEARHLQVLVNSRASLQKLQ